MESHQASFIAMRRGDSIRNEMVFAMQDDAEISKALLIRP